MTPEQKKYMLALMEITGEKATASKVARRFGVNRSTVTRVLSKCIADGFLTDKYQFTNRGYNYIEEYLEWKNKIFYYMIRKGVPYDIAQNDAIEVICSCRTETIASLLKAGDDTIDCKKKSLQRVSQVKFGGDEAQTYMRYGEYAVPFMFSKLKRREASMANEAFEHPAILCINKTGSYLRMQPVDITRKIVFDKELKGRLKSMYFEKDGEKVSIEMRDGMLYIPIEIFAFLYVREDNILQGRTKLHMSCTVGKLYMPESTAELNVYL